MKLSFIFTSFNFHEYKRKVYIFNVFSRIKNTLFQKMTSYGYGWNITRDLIDWLMRFIPWNESWKPDWKLSPTLQGC